eukprot:GEMP01083649.1.p1 GENE.GEMP01083649.1~~GEMP01083649.1.p1  ORF type:complete len:183 (+),score=11.69 GEMP01083649.1:187-735(+)
MGQRSFLGDRRVKGGGPLPLVPLAPFIGFIVVKLVLNMLFVTLGIMGLEVLCYSARYTTRTRSDYALVHTIAVVINLINCFEYTRRLRITHLTADNLFKYSVYWVMMFLAKGGMGFFCMYLIMRDTDLLVKPAAGYCYRSSWTLTGALLALAGLDALEFTLVFLPTVRREFSLYKKLGIGQS